MARQFLGDAGHILGRHPGLLAPFLEGPPLRLLLEKGEPGLDADRLTPGGCEGHVHEQVAPDRKHLVVRVDRGRPAALHHDQRVGVPAQAQPRGAHERPRPAIADFDQPGGIGPGGLAVRFRAGLVGALEELGVVAAIVEHPPQEAERERGILARLDGQPHFGLARQLREPRVHHRDPGPPLSDPLGQPDRPVGGAVVGLEKVRADEEDILGSLEVRLPVELLAAGELAVLVLLADGLAGEVQGALTHGRVPVEIGSAVACSEPFDEIAAAALQPPPRKHELVVPRSEVRVVGIDQGGQLGLVLGLELRDRHLVLADRLGVFGHGLGGAVVAQHHEGSETLDLTGLFPGDVGEQPPALDDLRHGLIEGNTDPPLLAALTGSLEHRADPIRVVDGLHGGLALRAETTVDSGRIVHGRCHGQVRDHGPRAVRAPVDLGDETVLQLHLHAAPRVAVHAR